MGKVFDEGLKVRNFKLQLHYYINFQTNALGKSMKPY